MGYDVHITRRQEWSDESEPRILESEWEAYVSTEEQMVITGFAECTSPQGETIRITQPLLTEWRGHSSGHTVWFSYFEGNVSVKNPDEETLEKMRQVASSLKAFVQGDEGERYDVSVAKNESKPWWKRLF